LIFFPGWENDPRFCGKLSQAGKTTRAFAASLLLKRFAEEPAKCSRLLSEEAGPGFAFAAGISVCYFLNFAYYTLRGMAIREVCV
jgi:hypothetical protein